MVVGFSWGSGLLSSIAGLRGSELIGFSVSGLCQAPNLIYLTR